MEARKLRQPEEVSPGLEVLSPNQVAALTGRHPETVTKALRLGELRGHQRVEGGRWRVRRADALAWAAGEAQVAA